jgi:photosynthetic reaction center cytochrome c subunit
MHLSNAARRLAFTAVALSALLLSTTAGSVKSRASTQSSPNGTAAQPTAAQKYKNIQVLKDIPADQLIPSMQFIAASLGVECDFCHVEREFDKDDKKEKKTARKMMEMMFAINKNNFEGEREVTCNTCHRGSPHPVSIPAVAIAGAKPPAMAAMHDHEHEMNPENLPAGGPVLAEYIQALGGEDALDKVSSRVEKATADTGDGHPVSIDIYSKAPDQRVSVMHMPKGDSVTAFNGSEGWLTFPGRPLREMSASDRLAAKLDAEAFFPTQLQKQFTTLKLQEHPEKVGERETDVVIGTTAGEPPVKLYFDKSSGLLLRMLHYTDTPLGLNPVQIDFADYRAVNGVKTPYRWTLSRPSGSFTIQVTEAEQNVPMAADRFTKPAPNVPPAEKAAGH